MYTQCPKCETVFKMSAEVLRAAGGQVKCGQCGEVFNALARLAEDPNAFAPSESSIEMETRADRILESSARTPPPPRQPPASQPAAPTEDATELEAADVEFARLQVIDVPPETLEFSLPPTELDRVFVEAKPATRTPAKREPPPAPPPRAPAHGRAPPPRSAPPSSRAAPAAPEVPPAAAVPAAPSASLTAEMDLGGEDALPPHPESRAAREVAQRPAAGGEVSDEVRHAMLAGMAETTLEPLEPLEAPRPRPLTFFLWLAAALLLAAVLITQLVLSNRGWLARTFGMGSATRPNLTAYQQQVWGVTGDPSANGTLRVRASILNASAQLQPYPLLRITLTDRFGNRLGMRDFEPSEYVGKPTLRMLAPGERIDATLDIQDPGKEAEGYELDVCLRAEQHVVCASDAAARSAQ